MAQKKDRRRAAFSLFNAPFPHLLIISIPLFFSPPLAFSLRSNLLFLSFQLSAPIVNTSCRQRQHWPTERIADRRKTTRWANAAPSLPVPSAAPRGRSTATTMARWRRPGAICNSNSDTGRRVSGLLSTASSPLFLRVSCASPLSRSWFLPKKERFYMEGKRLTQRRACRWYHYIIMWRPNNYITVSLYQVLKNTWFSFVFLLQISLFCISAPWN